MSKNATLQEIPNLWPEIEVNVVSPVAILRTQAALLRQVTKGLILGDVTTTTKGEFTRLTLDFVVPALDRYRYRLITVEHNSKFIYPVNVTFNLQPWSPYDGEPEPYIIHSQEEFMERIGSILKDQRTIGLIQSLIARINDERVAEIPSAVGDAEEESSIVPDDAS